MQPKQLTTAVQQITTPVITTLSDVEVTTQHVVTDLEIVNKDSVIQLPTTAIVISSSNIQLTTPHSISDKTIDITDNTIDITTVVELSSTNNIKSVDIETNTFFGDITMAIVSSPSTKNAIETSNVVHVPTTDGVTLDIDTNTVFGDITMAIVSNPSTKNAIETTNVVDVTTTDGVSSNPSDITPLQTNAVTRIITVIDTDFVEAATTDIVSVLSDIEVPTPHMINQLTSKYDGENTSTSLLTDNDYDINSLDNETFNTASYSSNTLYDWLDNITNRLDINFCFY
jgi:hypothetical protein